MRRTRAFAAMLAAVVPLILSAASADAQVLVRHAVSIEMAKTMANVAQETCADMGYSISVHVVDTAHRVGRPVGLCGEAAGDPAAVLLFLAAGVDNLSASPGNVGRVKRVIRTFSRQSLQELLARALEQEDPAPIRAMATELLEREGLGGLVRAGT